MAEGKWEATRWTARFRTENIWGTIWEITMQFRNFWTGDIAYRTIMQDCAKRSFAETLEDMDKLRDELS
jgi:hypothetical protein